MGKVLRTLMAAALVATVGVACGDDDDDESTADEFAGETSTSTTPEGEEEPLAFEESAADAVLEYSLVDYNFEGPLEATAGKLFFKATNNGTEDHELEILDSTGEALGEIVAMPPEADGEFAAELAAGTYKFQCILENSDGKPHTELGMVADFVVK